MIKLKKTCFSVFPQNIELSKMDNCNLEKLTIKPGKLVPMFKIDVLEYAVTVGSNIENISVDCSTRDTGASYSISNSGGSRTVPLIEGQINEIKIEVTAEDGTTKNYWVRVHRRSAKDATLSDLKVNIGVLQPEFSADCLQYNVCLPADKCDITVTAAVPDPKAQFSIKGGASGAPMSLSLSLTRIDIDVTSPDGSNKATYSVIVTKKQIPRYIRIEDSKRAMKFECPISLTALYQPLSIRGSDPKHTFSGPVLREFTKTSKQDPLNQAPLELEDLLEDFTLDAEMSSVVTCVPLINGEISGTTKMNQIGAQLKEYNKTHKITAEGVKYSTDAPLSHKSSVRGWEKQLQQIFDESNATKLNSMAEESIMKYFGSLPKHGRKENYTEGNSPLDFLNHAIHCYATALKRKSSDPNLNLRLGLVLEEKYYAEDLFGIKKETAEAGFPTLNQQAKESSRAEECDAIAALRGVGADAPLALKLKAIDQEYHHLVESGQSGKAEHVMSLFQWKSKQAMQEGAAAQKAADDTSPLGQASLKYLDALSLDESKAVFHFHVGRSLVIKGDYDDATKRLEATLGWNDKHQMAKFYLGMSLCLRIGGPGSRTKETIAYLAEALETLLQQNTEEALKADETERKPILHGENLLRANNVHLLRGFIQLGKLLRANPDVKDCMSAADVFHTAALLASQVLPTVVRADTYKQIEWVLLEAHSQLLELLLSRPQHDKALIAQRCQRLSALIQRSTIPANRALLDLQLKTCQMLVEIAPGNSEALQMLGSAQFAQYENDPDTEAGKQFLEEAKSSFRASIALEGKPTNSAPPQELIDEKWWKDKLEAEAKKKAEAESAGKTAAPAARGRGAPAARGAPARGGATAGRGGAAAAGRGGAAAERGGATAARGGAARGAAKAPTTPARGLASKPTSAKGAPTAAKKSDHKCETSKTPVAPKADSPTETPTPTETIAPTAETPAANSGVADLPVTTNKKTHHARLGLARSTSKNTDDLSEAKKYYNEVIDIAPEVHDAYVESAELLASKDPLGAVDIYCRFPVSAEPTFDDAFIFGEIVRLLMKQEKFDDPRLGSMMIAYGKVMGLGVLERYIKILDDKFKADLCKQVYAGVNGRSVDDPDLQPFFKMKCWI